MASAAARIPGDAIFGQFRRGQGLLVHTRDCQTLKKSRVDSDQIVDVEWAPDVQGVFEAGIRLLVADERGLLARLATEIADAGANIAYVSMERPDGDDVVAMFFTVQVRDRRHLAHVMRCAAAHPRSQARAARSNLIFRAPPEARCLLLHSALFCRYNPGDGT